MTKKKSDWREWLAFNLGILVFTILWYGMEVHIWDFPIEAAMFLLMFGMNFLAGLFGKVGLYVLNTMRGKEVNDV